MKERYGGDSDDDEDDDDDDDYDDASDSDQSLFYHTLSTHLLVLEYIP
jgi:hypothetical protein